MKPIKQAIDAKVLEKQRRESSIRTQLQIKELEGKYQDFCNIAINDALRVSLCVDIDDACIGGASHTNTLLDLSYKYEENTFYITDEHYQSNRIAGKLTKLKFECPSNMLDILASIYIYTDASSSSKEMINYKGEHILNEISNQLLYPLISQNLLDSMQAAEIKRGDQCKLSLDYDHRGSYSLRNGNVQVSKGPIFNSSKYGMNNKIDVADKLTIPLFEEFKQSVTEYYGESVISRLSFEQAELDKEEEEFNLDGR